MTMLYGVGSQHDDVNQYARVFNDVNANDTVNIDSLLSETDKTYTDGYANGYKAAMRAKIASINVASDQDSYARDRFLDLCVPFNIVLLIINVLAFIAIQQLS